MFECPVCGYEGPFDPFGDPPRPEARCPSCGSLERHRKLWVLQTARAFAKPGQAVLHFAPRGCLASALRSLLGKGYTTADKAPGFDKQMDMADTGLSSKSVDLVIASHVLEHIVDDMAALRELKRILKIGGRAVLMVPVLPGTKTVEDNAAPRAGPAERLKAFGQDDHVRIYGDDFVGRVRAAGLQCEQVKPTDKLFQGGERFNLGVETVFIARRRK